MRYEFFSESPRALQRSRFRSKDAKKMATIAAVALLLSSPYISYSYLSAAGAHRAEMVWIWDEFGDITKWRVRGRCWPSSAARNADEWFGSPVDVKGLGERWSSGRN